MMEIFIIKNIVKNSNEVYYFNHFFFFFLRNLYSRKQINYEIKNTNQHDINIFGIAIFNLKSMKFDSCCCCINCMFTTMITKTKLFTLKITNVSVRVRKNKNNFVKSIFVVLAIHV